MSTRVISLHEAYGDPFSGLANRILTGLCMVHDLSVTDVSHWIGVHPGTFRKWLHQGTLPSAAFQEQAEQFFRSQNYFVRRCHLERSSQQTK